MARPNKERPILPPIPPADLTQRQAAEEGEARRQAYLATLDPRQREMLDPQPKPV